MRERLADRKDQFQPGEVDDSFLLDPDDPASMADLNSPASLLMRRIRAEREAREREAERRKTE